MSQGSQPLRVGLIGVGFGAVVHAPAFLSEGCELVAVVASRQERADEAAAKFGAKHALTDYRRLLELDDVDAVAIASPVADHHPMTLAALAAGKHVLCEKPFGLDLAQAVEMRDAAQRAGLTAMVAHEFRFASGRQLVKERLTEGYVGTPQFARVSMLLDPPALRPAASGPPDYAPRRDDAAQGAGILFGLGSHYIDGLLDWFGPITRVAGHVRNLSPDRLRDGVVVQATADNLFNLELQFASGVLAQMTAGFGLPFAAASSIEIYGDQGALVTPQKGPNPPPHGPVLGARRGEAALQELEIPERLASFSDARDERLFPFRVLVRRFLEGIRTGTSPSPNFDDAVRVQQVLDAVRRASAQGVAQTL